MDQNQPHQEQSSRDRIVEEVSDKVQQRPSVDAPREEIVARAERSVDSLAEKPVQTFTPLLAENEVLGSVTRDRQSRDRGHDPDDGDPDESA